jgi:hypothetical protein
MCYLSANEIVPKQRPFKTVVELVFENTEKIQYRTVRWPGGKNY